MSAPETGKPLSRAAVMGLTLLADVVGSVLIVAVLPLSWTIRVILVAILLSMTNAAARLYLRRRAGAA